MLKRIFQSGLSVTKAITATQPKQFHLGAAFNVKQILETRNGKQLVIEGITVPSPREELLVRHNEDSDACAVCRLDIDIKHTDVLILSQFIRKDGCMLPRRITGLCKLQQKRIGHMVAMANKAGLMASLYPRDRQRDFRARRKEHNKCNVYYDESTIKAPYDRYRVRHPKLPPNWW